MNDQGTQPNTFERLLPTAGGILGGLISLPAEALDLVSGGGGTALNIAGAAGGAALGKSLENKLTGQAGGNGVLGAAIGGGVGQGLGSAGGAVLGKVGGKLVSAGAGRALSAADEAAASQARTAATSEAQRVADTFGGLKTGQGDVGGAIDMAKQFGINNATPEDLQNLGYTYTGSNPESGTGVLNFYKQQALDNAGGNVDLSKTMENLHNTLADPNYSYHLGSEEPVSTSRGQIPHAPDNVASKITQQVRNLLPGASFDAATGKLTGNVTPEEGVQILKKIGQQVGKTNKITDSTGTIIPEKQAENQVWKSVYSDIKDAVYNRPEVDSTVAGLKVGPDEESVIDDALRANNISDPQIAAKIKSHLIDTINGSQTGSDLLKAEQPFVNVARVGDNASKDIATDVTSARAVRRAKTLADAGMPVQTGVPGASDHLVDAAGHLATGSKIKAIASLIKASGATSMPGKIAGRTGSALERISKLVPSAGAALGTIPSIGTPGVTPNSAITAPQGGTTMNGAGAGPINPFLSLTGQAPAVYQPIALQALLGMFDPAALNSSVEDNAANASGVISKAQGAASQIPGLVSEFNQAGGAQGPIGGLLSKLSAAFTGGPASQYNAQAAQAAQALSAATGIPVSQLMTPQITQNQQSAQDTINQLSQLLSQYGGGSVLSGVPALGG